MTTAASDRGVRTALPGVAHRLVLVALVLSQLLQQPGRTTFDTKLDLTVDPVRLLEGSLHLWNPLLSFGELQNQAYGYLFPLGSFFALGDAVGLPPWLVQRLWSAVVLVAAFEGARRLHRALAPSTAPSVWLVAGVAYALVPRTLGLVGVLSAEALPAAVLPWMALPLVHAVSGRYSPRLGAGLSGVAFLFVGGVNATAAVAILPLPALLILCGRGPGSRLRLAAWWTAAVLAASAWWVLPLVVLGRYSPRFLDVIETARATTAPLGWSNVARGLDHWLFFVVVDGSPWWTGASVLASSPAIVVATAAVAALSFVGLLHLRMPARLPLAASALLGVILMVLAHDGAFATPLASFVRDLLDGVVAPLRNVHKLDPIVRLPLALGLAHLAGLLLARRRAGSAEGQQRVVPRRRRHLAGVGFVGVCALLVATAWPVLTGTSRQAGWDEVPVEWRQAAVYLGERADAGRTWVLPGSGFGRQTWGRTVDEPLQPLARAAWVTRSQVPLVPQQTLRYLDALEARVSDGRGSPALADALARAGIGHVLLRHDLDAAVTTAPPAERVGAALQQSGGLTLVESFDDDAGASRIDVYRVEPHVATVDLTSVEDVVRVTGAPDDVVGLLEGGVLPPDRPTILLPTDTEGVDAVGDGFQRRERQFGRTYDAVGPLLTPSEPYRQAREVHDYAGPDGVERVTASSPSGARATASSSSGYPDTVGPVRPELGPAAAVDGSAETMWRSAPLEDPQGQWLEVAVPTPRPVEHVDITAAVDGFSGIPVRRIRVTTDAQSVDQDVDPDSGFARVRLTGAPVSTVRVTVTAVRGAGSGVVALREVALPGLEASPEAVLPGSGMAPGTDVHFRADPGRRACTGAAATLRCDPELARSGDESTGLRRVFSTTDTGTWAISGTVVAVASPPTLALLDPPDGAAARVRASSVLGSDPLVAPAFAHDGNPATWWSSAVGDPAPSLTVTWGEERAVSGLRVRLAPATTRVPRVAVVEAGGQVREVTLDAEGLVAFPPVRATEATIRFPVDARESDRRLPLAVAEVELDGVQDLAYRPDRSTHTGALCGFGPPLTIDGRSVETEVRGTLADVLDGTPLQLHPCSSPGQLRGGDHRLSVTSTDRYAVTSMTMTADAPPGESVGERALTVDDWQATNRVLTVGAGGEAVLRVAENSNPGWRATLDGVALEPLVLDGWQQGYTVPSGDGGRIDLEFTPDRTYRAGLLIGAGLAGLLAMSGLVALWRRSRSGPSTHDEPRWAQLRDRPAVRTALIVGSVLLGGVPLAAGVLGGSFLRSRQTARLYAAGWSLTAAGVVSAVAVSAGQGTVFGPADFLAGVGLGLLVAALPFPATEAVPDDEEHP